MLSLRKTNRNSPYWPPSRLLPKSKRQAHYWTGLVQPELHSKWAVFPFAILLYCQRDGLSQTCGGAEAKWCEHRMSLQNFSHPTSIFQKLHECDNLTACSQSNCRLKRGVCCRAQKPAWGGIVSPVGPHMHVQQWQTPGSYSFKKVSRLPKLYALLLSAMQRLAQSQKPPELPPPTSALFRSFWTSCSCTGRCAQPSLRQFALQLAHQKGQWPDAQASEMLTLRALGLRIKSTSPCAGDHRLGVASPVGLGSCCL